MVALFRRSWAKTAIAIGAIGVIVIVVGMRPDRTAGPCAVAQPETLLPEIPEASSLAVSRRNPGILWSHNDSGNQTMLFALDAKGSLRGRIRVPIPTRDWEDISAARCPTGPCLFLADIGDNRSVRRRIRIHRVPEPLPGDAETAAPDVFNATYTDGPHNAEALFVVGADLFIVTRDRVGGLYRSRLVPDSNDLRFERLGELRLEAVTDAEASPDESLIVVRTSDEVIIYRTADVIRGGTVPYGLRIPIGGLKEPQGEGVALGADGMLYLTSEGMPWNRAGRFLSLRCTWPGTD